MVFELHHLTTDNYSEKMPDKIPMREASRQRLCRGSKRLFAPVTFAICLTGCQSLITSYQQGFDNATEDTHQHSGSATEYRNGRQHTEKVWTEYQFVVAEESTAIDEPVAEIEEFIYPPQDLIAVIRDGLTLDVNTQNSRVQLYLNSYSSSSVHFDRIFERAKPYLYHIVDEVKKRGMPMELALLPMVESAFDPFAYSFASAAGLWQFIPSTGSYYGLRQDWWYDGRRDVLASTDAALTYLQSLYDSFGSWELALAAYNSGRGTVSNAISRNRNAGKATDFWALSLPKETSAYVPKLLAASAIIRNPDRYNLTIDTIANAPYFDVVEIGLQMDLTQAAKLAGITINEMHRLNPAFNRWATSPDGPHHLLIPVEKAYQFRTALANLPQEQRLQWQRYKILPGDTLTMIAKRFDTTTQVIQGMNRLSDSKVIAGQVLIIPMPDNTSGVDISMTQDQPRSIDELLTDNLIRKVFYQVRDGDSLSVIANRYGVKVSDINSWNALNSNKHIRPGDNLTLYVDVTQNM